MTGRIRLGDMVRAGGRSVSQYTGTVLAMFVVQFVAAWLAGVAILLILDGAFGQRPIFDDAVDGDLVSLLIAPAVVAMFLEGNGLRWVIAIGALVIVVGAVVITKRRPIAVSPEEIATAEAK